MFFRVPTGDMVFLAFLVSFSVLPFLPWARRTVCAGMPMQGWLLAALMILAPTIALVRLLLSKPDREQP